MGQKVHPTGIRLGIVKDHNSVWYADSKAYAKNLISDLENYLEEKGYNPFGVKLVPAYAEVSKVSKEGSWTEQDKKSFKAFRNLM